MWVKMEDLILRPQMWMSSLVLTIHNFGVPKNLTHTQIIQIKELII